MPKRGENICKRKDGRWEARYIRDRDDSGKAKYGYVYAHSYRDVKAKREQKLKELPQSDEAAADGQLFGGVLDAYIEYQRFRVKESSLARYSDVVNTHLKPLLGYLKVSAIDTAAIDALCNRLLTSGRKDGKGGLSPKTVKDILTLLKSILKYAKERGYMQTEAFITPPKKEDHEICVLTHPEQEKLELYSLKEDPLAFGIYLCLYTGLRIGEICGLRWSDIDFEHNLLYVRRKVIRITDTSKNATQKTKLLIDSPKSEASKRQIPLPAFLVRQLETRKTALQSDYYLLTGSANVIEPRNYYLKYRQYLSICGIREYTFHTLRHTFATRCIECGFDVKSLSEILGHANVKITLDRYVHPSLDLKRSHMELLTPAVSQSAFV